MAAVSHFPSGYKLCNCIFISQRSIDALHAFT